MDFLVHLEIAERVAKIAIGIPENICLITVYAINYTNLASYGV